MRAVMGHSSIVLRAARFVKKVGACYRGSVQVDHFGEKALLWESCFRACCDHNCHRSRSVSAARFGEVVFCRCRVLTCASAQGHVTAVVVREMRRDPSVGNIQSVDPSNRLDTSQIHIEQNINSCT